MLRTAALVHDVGKITVPAEILTKPTRLSEIEFALIKEHAGAAYEILEPIDFGGPVAEIVAQHHERLDGSGYPKGLASDEILPGASPRGSRRRRGDDHAASLPCGPCSPGGAGRDRLRVSGPLRPRGGRGLLRALRARRLHPARIGVRYGKAARVTMMVVGPDPSAASARRSERVAQLAGERLDVDARAQQVADPGVSGQ